eukprot:scaffold170834_cov20-Prasinocladus_malaysianus.AAC.1
MAVKFSTAQPSAASEMTAFDGSVQARQVPWMASASPSDDHIEWGTPPWRMVIESFPVACQSPKKAC